MVNGRTRNKRKVRDYVTAVVADEAGNIFDLEGYAAVGMSGYLDVKACSGSLKNCFGLMGQ